MAAIFCGAEWVSEMSKRTQYDENFKASAVATLQAMGYPDNPYKLQQLAKQLKIPSRTLRRWWNGQQGAPDEASVTQVKKALSERLEDAVHLLLDELPDTLEAANAQQLLTGVGILIDKLQLLTNKPTEHVQHAHSGHVTVEERASRALELLERARARRDGRAADGYSDA